MATESNNNSTPIRSQSGSQLDRPSMVEPSATVQRSGADNLQTRVVQPSGKPHFGGQNSGKK